MKTKCIIIDDEPLAVELLKSYVEKTPFLKLIGSFSSAVSAMETINEMSPDLIFLDIQMPEVNGITFAHAIPDTTRIIFTTAFDQYAVEGYRLNAVDYLVKPISYNDFVRAAHKANMAQNAMYNIPSPLGMVRHEPIWVKSESKYVQIEVSNISYVEGVKDYVNLHFANKAKPVLSLMRMKKVEKILPEEFVRIHKSYIVNMNHVNLIERGYVICNGERLPIGNNYKESLMKHVHVSN
ncbi:MAG: response regulator transcription factor [Bacteroidales bacterium]|jgi:two-component system LytT family response regulator|nr:response regulator transcription factor [Bacteroidales bacterium]